MELCWLEVVTTELCAVVAFGAVDELDGRLDVLGVVSAAATAETVGVASLPPSPVTGPNNDSVAGLSPLPILIVAGLNPPPTPRAPCLLRIR